MGNEDVNVGEVTAEATKFDPIMKAKSKTTCLMFALKFKQNGIQSASTINNTIHVSVCLSVCSYKNYTKGQRFSRPLQCGPRRILYILAHRAVTS